MTTVDFLQHDATTIRAKSNMRAGEDVYLKYCTEFLSQWMVLFSTLATTFENGLEEKKLLAKSYFL